LTSPTSIVPPGIVTFSNAIASMTSVNEMP
jgi:hypothetical protein